MAIDKQLPANCLGVTTDARCVKVNVSIPGLEVDPGDSLDYALQQLASFLPSEDGSSQEFIDSNLYCLGGSGNSVCAAKVVNRTMAYNIKPTLSGMVTFTWDLTSIRHSLPPGYVVTSISVVANSSNVTGAILNSSAAKATTSFQTANYPIVIDISMRIDTDCGQIELTKMINLFNSADSGDKVAVMDLKDYTAGTIQDITQNQYNELLAGEVCMAKDRLSALEQAKNYDAELLAISQRLSSLESASVGNTMFTQINCLGGIVTQVSLTDYLTFLNTKVCALETSLSEANATIASLQQQINNL